MRFNQKQVGQISAVHGKERTRQKLEKTQQCALVLLQRFARFQSLLVRAVELTAGLKNAEMQCKNTL